MMRTKIESGWVQKTTGIIIHEINSSLSLVCLAAADGPYWLAREGNGVVNIGWLASPVALSQPGLTACAWRQYT